MPIEDYLRLRKYPARMADNTPYMRRRYIRDDEGNWGQKWVAYSLAMKEGTVSAPLETGNGVPVLWNHGLGSFFGDGPSHSFGRVEEMAVRGGALVGAVLIASELLESYLPMGVRALDVGMNVGLSIGLMELGNSTLTKGKGTYEDPYKVAFGNIEVREVSLTAMPVIKSAALDFAGGRDVEDMKVDMSERAGEGVEAHSVGVVHRTDNEPVALSVDEYRKLSLPCYDFSHGAIRALDALPGEVT